MMGLVAELEQIQGIKDRMKTEAMTYQRRDKETVAEFYGLPFEQVDLPFNEWMELRRRYQQDSGKSLDAPQPHRREIMDWNVKFTGDELFATVANKNGMACPVLTEDGRDVLVPAGDVSTGYRQRKPVPLSRFDSGAFLNSRIAIRLFEYRSASQRYPNQLKWDGFVRDDDTDAFPPGRWGVATVHLTRGREEEYVVFIPDAPSGR